jgi:cysteinyl-tRNA synthetase
MCDAVLGETIDIHGGGWDLQFPHHENEIAQSEAASGKPFANIWMHVAFLNLDQEKMSKSLGNFFTLRDVLDRLDPQQGGETVRYFLLRGHYRSEINYSWDTLEDARQSLLGFYVALKDVPPEKFAVDWSNDYAKRFRDAMEDDLNTPIAFAVLHELRGEINRSRSPRLSALLKGLGESVGLFSANAEQFVRGQADTGELDVEALIARRNAAKQAKDFATADQIRKQLDLAGILLEDKPGGMTEWRRK